MHDLSGFWDLADGEGEHCVSMHVPGDVHSALHVAGIIPDPYVGRNEYAVRWVANRQWTLSRSFEDAGGRRLLAIDGLDCVSVVSLNGVVVLNARSAFREHVADVETLPGQNRIEIVLVPSPAAADAIQGQQPFRIPYHAGNCPIPNGNMLRKPQCDFGWDWNLAIAPLGVYGRIALVGPEGEIAGVSVRQTHEAGRATIDLTVRTRGFAAEILPWRVSLCGVEASGEAVAAPPIAAGLPTPPGTGWFMAMLEIEAPELWQPAGMGAQPLHDLVVEVAGQRRTFPVALRYIRLVSEPDAAGRSFTVEVNGRPVFCRGANWIPADALPGRISAEKTRDLLRSAADANMNMIRVWGGGRYEPDSFYEACDALGLLVWQDFMFACHLYPATEIFLSEVDREVREQAARLGRFVAIWCGDNELLGALGWFEESRRDRDRYLVAYDRLNRTIEAGLKAVEPWANWWPSSPSPGPMSFGDAWHEDGSGDMHFWSVWHEGRDFEHYRDVRPRFCSEFGFQSYPSMDVVRSFAGEDDLNIASPVMESHQKNAGGNARIAETMFRYFRFPERFENFVWLSQVQQGVAIRTAVDWWRSLKPRCMGTLYWQLNDTWPVASWSSLDYGGGWKLVHHMARRFFAPVSVVAIPLADGFALSAVNDTVAPVEVEVECLAGRPDGTTRPLAQASATIGTAAAEPLLDLPPLGDGEILVYRWRASNGASGEDHALAGRYKALDLRDPGLSLATEMRDGAVVARIEARALALFVTLEADRPGRFSDNAVTLLPGRPAEIVFTPADGDPGGVAFATRDLWSSARTPERGNAR